MALSLSYEELAGCRDCPRLSAHLATVREAHPDYHCQPVAAWGSPRARLLIVGLAPGLHGANRSGQPFTGDASGTFLFAALSRFGLASDPDPSRARLHNVRITNAVKCLPPGNRPLPSEIRQCGQFLRIEIDQLWSERARKPRCVLCLGHLAHDALGHVLGQKLPAFRHGQILQLKHNFWFADTYHPSRQNTNTRRLTAEMFDAVIHCAARLVAV
ncbi:MAG: uracil-DNA glycosylase [Pseudomonadales bacterium]